MSTGRNLLLAALFAAAALALSHADATEPAHADRQSIERGRYIARIAGCNDCHTAGYAVSGGKTAEKDWLMGDALGWRGDWGTTYPPNLRIALSKMTENEWVRTAKSATYRPPMPWFALHDMNEQDLRAFYRFVRQLGPVGNPAPAYVPPGQAPIGPFIQFPAMPQ
ncbi:MAG: cytochrome C [Burkholderiales bacterium]|nr:cytochrome C [Burkholderiales bacterium]